MINPSCVEFGANVQTIRLSMGKHFMTLMCGCGVLVKKNLIMILANSTAGHCS